MLLTYAQNTVVNLAFLGAVAFIVGYSRSADWWTYRVGRAVASLDVCVALTLFPGILHLWFHVNTTDTFYGWYKVSSLFLVFLTTMWRLYTVDHLNRHAVESIPESSPDVSQKEEVL